MSVLWLKYLTKVFFPTLFLFSLSACMGGGTADIMGDDDRTFVGSVAIEKSLSERSAIDISYLATAGSNDQFISTGVQFNGERVTEGTINNRFTFQTLTAHYEYTYFLGKRFRHTAASAFQLSYIDLNSNAGAANPSFYELYPAYGLKLGSSFSFSDSTRAALDFAVYDQKASTAYLTSGIWLEHDVNKDFQFKVGYTTHRIDDGASFSRDRCTTEDALPEDCDDSGFGIRASGLHLGFELKR